TVLPELPLTSSGKLDRAALQPAAAAAPAELSTATQRRLAGIWAQVLGIDASLRPDDDFFLLGGNSLSTVRLLSRIRDGFAVDLQLRQLLSHPVLADQAAAIDEAAAPAADRAHSAADRPHSAAEGREGRWPLSWQQEGLWFLYQLDPESMTYHLALRLRLRGELDLAALRESLRLLVARHEGLRTRFEQVDGVGYQLIDAPPAEVDLLVVDLPATGWQQLMAAEEARPFVLDRQWPMRCWLGRFTDQDHVLVLTLHHIAADGWSAGILTDELAQCYSAVRAGQRPELEPASLPRQPADHAAWQRRDGAEQLAAGLDYWQEQLAGLAELELPTDRPRPARPTGAGELVTGHVPAEVGAGLSQLAAELHVPLLSVLLAGFLVVLNRYTGQDDLAVGSIFSGRIQAELRPMVGYFVNSVVLRTSAAGDPSFTDLVDRCSDTVLDALEFQDIPFTAIVDALRPPRVPGRNPLFQTCLNLQPAAAQGEPALSGLQVEGVPFTFNQARFDLTLHVTPQPDDSFALLAEYSTELFDPDRIHQLLGHFGRVLGQVAGNPEQHLSDIAVLDPAEQLHTGYTTATGLPTTTEQSATTRTELATATQRRLAGIWAQVLDVEDTLQPQDNFFLLGGSSLLAMQLLSRIRDGFAVDLQLRELFLRPVLAELAEAIDALADAEPIENPVSRTADLAPADRGGRLPLSWQQEGLWFLYQSDRESTTYHLVLGVRLHGALDVAALRESLRLLVVRHEGVRTRFEQVAGVGYQVIDPAPAGVDLPVVELPAAGWQRLVAEEVRRPFVFERQWPLRWWLGRLAEQDHVLVVTVHHIAADGWSVAILAGELERGYAAVRAGRELELEPLSVQPADYAVWQRRHGADQLAAGLDYWRRQLTGLTELQLPTDRPRPAQPTGAGAMITERFPAEIGTGLTSLATELHVPLLSVLLAGFVVVLNRYTGQDDLAVGSVLSGRIEPALRPMLGYFVNSVVLRTSTAGDPSFAELVGRCSDTVLDALDYQDIPFSAVVEALRPPRIPGRNPLFQVSLSLFPQELTGAHRMDLAGLEVEDVLLEAERSRFDLSLQVTPQADDSLAVSVEYSVELFDADRIHRLVRHWQTALSHALADPHQHLTDLTILTPTELQDELIACNATELALPAGCLHERFERQVALGPDRIAVQLGAETMTYAALNATANRIARWLRRIGVRTGGLIGVSLPPSPRRVAVILGIMKAGCGCLPLDPELPAQRLSFLIMDASVLLVVTDSATSEKLPATDRPCRCIDREWPEIARLDGADLEHPVAES
ncbi:MAG TPA: condensation domain-containing protein, partial [Jatrophihabitans sp.]|nr:condensation domain-containing protein [Jatrophihabitans sp.]